MEIKQYKVYKYTSPSNKVYIGQTCQSIGKRAMWNGKGYKHSTHFYAAIQKYGFENFQVEILKDNLTLEEANYWEIYYIKLYNSTDREKGYNISLGGNNHIISKEQLEKMSKRMKENNPMKNPEISQKVSEKLKGRSFSEETIKNMSNRHKKMVQCIETGEIFESRNAAAEAVGVSPSGIGRAINGEQKTSAGYHWRYINEDKELN